MKIKKRCFKWKYISDNNLEAKTEIKINEINNNIIISKQKRKKYNKDKESQKNKFIN